MLNFNEMGKMKLRQACKDIGIKGYGKMNNDGMRAALKAVMATKKKAPVSTMIVLASRPQQTINASKKKAERKAAPAAVRHSLKIEKEREERNGIKRPSAGGQCRAVWDTLDEMVKAGGQPTIRQVKALAEERGWNLNNASIEFYQWRKFNGIRGRQRGE